MFGVQNAQMLPYDRNFVITALIIFIETILCRCLKQHTVGVPRTIPGVAQNICRVAVSVCVCVCVSEVSPKRFVHVMDAVLL
jgi:hypothetical protein